MTHAERAKMQLDLAQSYQRDAARAMKAEDYRRAESALNLAAQCLKRAESAAADAAGH